MTFFPKESYKASQKYLKILHWVGNILWKSSKERNISKESSDFTLHRTEMLPFKSLSLIAVIV